MDNLSSHKKPLYSGRYQSNSHKAPVAATYSPDLTPIEQAFSIIKHWMRMAQERSVDTVNKALAQFINTITPSECSNYFRNAGYDHS